MPTNMSCSFRTLFCVVCLVALLARLPPIRGFLVSPAGGVSRVVPRARETTMVAFLSSEPENTDDENLKQLQTIVGLTDAELKRILSRVPQIAGISADEARTSASYLQETLSLDATEFKKKLVLRLPQCLGYDPETEIAPSLAAVREKLALSEDDLRSLVLKCPQMVGLDFDTAIAPNIETVVTNCGGDFAAARELILKSPAKLNLAVRGAASRTAE